MFFLSLCQDVIELGVPFTDPIADGPTIQTSNTVSLAEPNALDALRAGTLTGTYAIIGRAQEWCHNRVDAADGA